MCVCACVYICIYIYVLYKNTCKKHLKPPTSLSQGGFFTTGDHDDALLQRSGVVWKERRFNPQKWWYHEILWDIQTSGSGFGISTNWQFWKADEGSIYLQNGSKWSILPTNMIRNPWSKAKNRGCWGWGSFITEKLNYSLWLDYFCTL